MKTRTRLAFALLTISAVLFLNQTPVKAQDACEAFGDWTMASWESNCYPDMGNEFCEASDTSCWETAGLFTCSAWYGVCLDIADPCLYWCCCRVR